MSGFPAHPRPRPVADAPIDALLERGEELAKSWAVALVLALPLGRIGEIPLEDLSRRAPALIARAIRALASDAELELLCGDPQRGGAGEGNGQGRLGSLTGAHDPMAAVRAVESLRGVLWEALLEELRAPAARAVAELADRLAHVCSAIAAAAVVHELDVAVDVDVASGADAGAESVWPASISAQAPPLPWDAEIEAHDARGGGEGPAAWIESIGRSLERYAADRMPFAVLLIEVIDIERLEHAQTPQELAEMTGQVESALAQGLRPEDLFTRERLGRYWLLSRNTDTAGARMLAERLARTARVSASHRGVPLEVAIGIAICPEDGSEASALAARADIGVYAARAAGQAVAPVDPA
ncbi:MAG TPA: diguanylate cyclase [Solirubrobacteraceae bacterium]|nr:diguanylate cyclase [Solirubrobacteraceae bacterium]